MNLLAAGDFDGVTTVYPLGLAAVCICALCMLTVPRRYALWPILALTCSVPAAQRVVVFGADFNFLRLLVLAGTLRVALLEEWRGFSWKPVDLVLLVWG